MTSIMGSAKHYYWSAVNTSKLAALERTLSFSLVQSIHELVVSALLYIPGILRLVCNF
jgi:hypothetical protein